jgi:hypothetical protein
MHVHLTLLNSTDDPNNTWRVVQISKLLITKIASVSSYSLSLLSSALRFRTPSLYKLSPEFQTKFHIIKSYATVTS